MYAYRESLSGHWQRSVLKWFIARCVGQNLRRADRVAYLKALVRDNRPNNKPTKRNDNAGHGCHAKYYRSLSM
jgi:hypothetical protein